jgi:hypothetical protein
MSAGLDATWGVPLITHVIAAVAGIWVYLSDRTLTRKYGPQPN